MIVTGIRARSSSLNLVTLPRSELIADTEKGIEVDGRRGDYRLLATPATPAQASAIARWSKVALGSAARAAM